MATRFGWHGRLALAGTLVAAFAVTAPAQAASTVKVDGGKTTLKVADATAGRFQALGVSVGTVLPARTGRARSTFPITGGSIDPATARGTLKHGGEFVFLSGRGSGHLELKAIQLEVADSSYLTAKVRGRRINVLKLAVKRSGVSRDGFGTVVKPVGATVTRAAARALNRALGERAVSTGQTFGKIGFEVDPAQILLTGGTTTLAFNGTTQGVLGQLGVAVAPIAPATAGTSGVSFPVTGGTLDAEDLAGTVEHSGGIALTSGPTRVDLTSPTVTFSDTPQLGATYSGAPIAIADVTVAGSPQIDATDRTISANLSAVRLTTTAAVALNSFFRTTVFTAGTDIGTATLTAQAR
jgi:hypothetical protein